MLLCRAIQAIPQEINEATLVDGAGYWQRVWRITLPLTARTILLVTLFSIIGSLLAFDQFFLMTAGQPFNQTASSVFWLYLNSFPYLKLGYGATLSLILAAIILACTVVQMWLSRRTHAEGGDDMTSVSANKPCRPGRLAVWLWTLGRAEQSTGGRAMRRDLRD